MLKILDSKKEHISWNGEKKNYLRNYPYYRNRLLSYFIIIKRKTEI